jgi:hypothetical protein
MVVTVKFCDDQYFSNKLYAKIGGIKCKELNLMETQFLKLLIYDLHVLPETFEIYSTKLLIQGSEEVVMVESMEANPPEQKGIKTCLSQESFKTVPSTNELQKE